ncbi:MAG: PKD domain-containing protein [bacterium]
MALLGVDWIGGSNSLRQVGSFLTDFALDLSAGKVYWLGNGVIQRAALSGLGVETLVNIGTAGLGGIALDLVAGKMYWTNNGILPRSIWRANLNGSNAEAIVTTGLSAPTAIALDLAGGKVYWSDNHAQRLQRANLDGTNVETFMNDIYESYGIAIDIQGNPTVNAGGPYSVNEGASVTVTASGNDPENGPLTYAWDLDNNGSIETAGQSPTFSAADFDGPGNHIITVQVTDNGGLTVTAQTTCHRTQCRAERCFHRDAEHHHRGTISDIILQ